MHFKIPHDNNLEIQFLAGLMGAGSLDDVIDVVNEARESWFFNDFNGGVFRTIRKIVGEGVNPDLCVVSSRHGDDDKVLDIDINARALPFELASVARQLKTLWMRREAIRDAERLMERASSSDTDGRAIVDAMNGMADRMTGHWSERTSKTTIDVIRAAVEDVQAASTGKSGRVFFDIDFIDEKVVQFPGQIHAIGAKSGKGKTTLALQMFLAQAKAGKNDLYFITESESMEIMKRLMACDAEIPTLKLLTGLESQLDVSRFKRAVENIKYLADNIRVYGPDEFDMTIEGIESAVRKAKRTMGTIDAVYLDYLQDLYPPRSINSSTTAEEIGYNAKRFKKICRDAGAAGVMLCQFSRDHEKKGHRPGMADFRGSGEIEHVCHLMSCLHRDGEEADNANQDDVETQWYSVKTRLVPHWARRLYFRGSTGRYVDAPDGHRYGPDDLPKNYHDPSEERRAS